MNYSGDLSVPRQRWYRYKEGYSLDLVKMLIQEYNKNPNGIILDPFLGSGSTAIAANQLGHQSIGFEVNPFSYFLSSSKLLNYTENEITEFSEAINEVVNTELITDYDLPVLSISDKVFTEEIEKYMMSVKYRIIKGNFTDSVKKLLKLGWLNNIEPLSNYRKAGNGLKKRKYVKPRVITIEDAKNVLRNTYLDICEDIKDNSINYNTQIYNSSSLEMSKYIENQSISGIIFSPPYANSFDYTEIYKLELWFGNFVNAYSDLKELRKVSVRSHLNAKYNANTIDNGKLTSSVLKLIDELMPKELWNKNIPLMLQSYYLDMFNIIDQAYNLLESDGFCSIIVGNSSYGGIIFPTDLLLAEYAEKKGFKVDKIEVDRYIITSSQQYEITKENGKFLRESVLCLVK